MSQNDTGAGFLAGLLIGAAVGAGLALVLAPRSGEETRELLLEKSEEMLSKADDLTRDVRQSALSATEDVRHRAGEFAEKAREVVTERVDEVKSAFDEGVAAAGGRPADSGKAGDWVVTPQKAEPAS